MKPFPMFRQVWWCDLINEPMIPTEVGPNETAKCPLCDWVLTKEEFDKAGRWDLHVFVLQIRKPKGNEETSHFRPEDVDALRLAADVMDESYGPLTDNGRFASLADRVAALLPPQ